MSPVRMLALHAAYTCRHRGVCCTEEWAIPVERVRHRRLLAALDSGHLRPSRTPGAFFEPAPGLDPDASVVVGRRGRECVFFEPGDDRLCAIHRDLGHGELPAACQHFPRVVVLDPRGVTLSLSHVCPTTVDLLFAAGDGWQHVVVDGPAAHAEVEWSGLDARDSLPPQVSASLLWDWESMTAFEQCVLDLLARLDPERVLAVVESAMLALEPSSAQPLFDRVRDAFVRSERSAPDIEVDVAGLAGIAARSAPGWRGDGDAGVRIDVDSQRLDAMFHELAPRISMYLAARLVASAVMYHARSARVWSAALQAAYAVLRANLAGCLAAGDSDVRRAFTEAAAASDRLLVHRADPARLASALAARSGLPS